MITAIVRYRLPSQIGEAECRAHYERIAAGFGEAPGSARLRTQFDEFVAAKLVPLARRTG